MFWNNFFARKSSCAVAGALGQLSQLTAALSDGVVIYDDEFRIISCNDRFAALVQLPLKTLISFEVTAALVNQSQYRRLALVFFPSVAAERLEILATAPIEIAQVHTAEPEELHFRLASKKLNLSDGVNSRTYWLKVASDETKTIIQEREVGEFLTLAAHHIRTPLNEIKWVLESINPTALNPDVAGPIQATLRTIETTLVLAERVLMSVQVETGDLQPVPEAGKLREVVETVLEVLAEPITERQLQVSVEIAPEAEQFIFDKKIITVILHAILENAVLYNRKNGTINLKANRQADQSSVEIAVTDSGVGIPIEEQERLFQRHFRGGQGRELKPEGFGLGLYLTKRLLDLIGGSVNFISSEKDGTTFRIYLPSNRSVTSKI